MKKAAKKAHLKRVRKENEWRKKNAIKIQAIPEPVHHLPYVPQYLRAIDARAFDDARATARNAA